MEKVEIKVLICCANCDKVVKEESLLIDSKYAGRVGRLPSDMPCIDCWNDAMGIFGNAKEQEKTETEKMLEEDEKDMHEGEEGEE